MLTVNGSDAVPLISTYGKIVIKQYYHPSHLFVNIEAYLRHTKSPHCYSKCVNKCIVWKPWGRV